MVASEQVGFHCRDDFCAAFVGFAGDEAGEGEEEDFGEAGVEVPVSLFEYCMLKYMGDWDGRRTSSRPTRTRLLAQVVC